MCSSTKRMAKMIPDINDGFSSFMAGLTTISTVSEATAKYDYRPEPAYLVHNMMILQYLRRKNCITSETTVSMMSAILLHPSTFGGLPVASLYTHTLRGQDDVPYYLNLYKYMHDTKIQEYQEILMILDRWIILQPTDAPNIRDYKRLVSDIFSLRCGNIPTIEQHINPFWPGGAVICPSIKIAISMKVVTIKIIC